MQLKNTLALGFLSISHVIAAPAARPVPAATESTIASNLFRRAPVLSVSCGPPSDQRAWPQGTVQGAVDQMQANVNVPNPSKPKAGTRTYPKRYDGVDPAVADALNLIPGCETGQPNKKYWEFPLLDPVFNGGNTGAQGPDRVIGIGDSPGQGGSWSLTYCLSVTHRYEADGDDDGSFRPCT